MKSIPNEIQISLDICRLKPCWILVLLKQMWVDANLRCLINLFKTLKVSRNQSRLLKICALICLYIMLYWLKGIKFFSHIHPLRVVQLYKLVWLDLGLYSGSYCVLETGYCHNFFSRNCLVLLWVLWIMLSIVFVLSWNNLFDQLLSFFYFLCWDWTFLLDRTLEYVFETLCTSRVCRNTSLSLTSYLFGIFLLDILIVFQAIKKP